MTGVLCICPVSSNVFENYFHLIVLFFLPRQVFELTVYCSEVCQQRDTRLHALRCKKNRKEHEAEQEKEDDEPREKQKGKGKYKKGKGSKK